MIFYISIQIAVSKIPKIAISAINENAKYLEKEEEEKALQGFVVQEAEYCYFPPGPKQLVL